MRELLTHLAVAVGAFALTQFYYRRKLNEALEALGGLLIAVEILRGRNDTNRD